MPVYRILTATYTDRVETLLFDPDAKSLSIASSLTVGHHPSWITPHPENPTIWFTALEQEDGRVVAVEYDKEGKGKVVGELSSEGAAPCTLVAYKGDLLIGNVSRFFFLPQGCHAHHFDRHIVVGPHFNSIRVETSSRSPSLPLRRTLRRPQRGFRSAVPDRTRIGSFRLTLTR